MRPFSFWKAAGGAFDPATLSLKTWLRVPYASPNFTGTASAGTSGANDFTSATPPANGAALNGYDTADFDGTNDYLESTDFAEVCVPVGGYVAAVLFRADALQDATVYPNTYNAAGLLSDPYGFNLGVDDEGLAIGHYDGAWKEDRLAGVSTGTWTLGQVRYDGTEITLRLNGGAWSTPLAAGSLGTPGSTYLLRMGYVALSATRYYDGRIAEVITAASLSDGDLDNYRSYLNARYGISV